MALRQMIMHEELVVLLPQRSLLVRSERGGGEGEGPLRHERLHLLPGAKEARGRLTKRLEGGKGVAEGVTHRGRERSGTAAHLGNAALARAARRRTRLAGSLALAGRLLRLWQLLGLRERTAASTATGAASVQRRCDDALLLLRRGRCTACLAGGTGRRDVGAAPAVEAHGEAARDRLALVRLEPLRRVLLKRAQRCLLLRLPLRRQAGTQLRRDRSVDPLALLAPALELALVAGLLPQKVRVAHARGVRAAGVR